METDGLLMKDRSHKELKNRMKKRLKQTNQRIITDMAMRRRNRFSRAPFLGVKVLRNQGSLFFSMKHGIDKEKGGQMIAELEYNFNRNLKVLQ